MSSLSQQVNGRSALLLGSLTRETSATALGMANPVMATPAIAAGTATAAAFGIGLGIEEAGDK